MREGVFVVEDDDDQVQEKRFVEITVGGMPKGMRPIREGIKADQVKKNFLSCPCYDRLVKYLEDSEIGELFAAIPERNYVIRTK